MPASSVLAVLVAVWPAAEAALQAPAGFQTVPIDGRTQVMVARQGDVYFVVRDLPWVLGAAAGPQATAARILTEATTRPKAAWTTLDGIDVIRFRWGDGDLGAIGTIGARGTKTRVATCQWGVGLQRSQPEERLAAIKACEAALDKVPGFEAPPARGGDDAEARGAVTEELPFQSPPGFEWRSDGAGSWLGMRGGDPEKGGGGEALGAYSLPFVFDAGMDLSRVTDEVAETMGEELKLESVDVVKLGDLDGVHFSGRARIAGVSGVAVEGYLVPRGRTTFLLFAMKPQAMPAELSASLKAAAQSVEGAQAPGGAPAKPSSGAAPDAGPPEGAKKKAAPAKKEDDDWKGALVVVVLSVVAIGLAVAMGLGRSRRRRRRFESSPPDPTPPP